MAATLGGDPEALRVLTTLLRTRPATVDELRALRGLPDDVDATLERLSGFVQRDGDLLRYADPTAVGGALAELVTLLPELARQWAQGDPESPVRVELVHGHEAQWRAWARHAALSPPRSPFNAYPTLDVLRDVIAPEIEQVAGPYGLRARAVIPASAVVTEDDRAVVETLRRAGMQVRLAGRVDSWFYSDPDVLCALPLVWGEHPPSSIMIVHDLAIRALTAAHAEVLWAAAEPYDVPTSAWDDVLRLLGRGMSDRAIATALGISVRTVERRIAEAMAHHRVGTRFELGAAWARQRNR